jgi:hypothetical protein
MLSFFPKTKNYLATLDISSSDPLDRKASELINSEVVYERASQALRRRFVRGALEVEGLDRAGRKTKIKREKLGGKFVYKVQGADGNWFEIEERIWIVSMYALWQDSKKSK